MLPVLSRLLKFTPHEELAIRTGAKPRGGPGGPSTSGGKTVAGPGSVLRSSSALGALFTGRGGGS